jgi:hypothetical protein
VACADVTERFNYIANLQSNPIKAENIASAFEFLTKAEIMKRAWNGQGEWDRG